jgi:hypothetical protein
MLVRVRRFHYLACAEKRVQMCDGVHKSWSPDCSRRGTSQHLAARRALSEQINQSAEETSRASNRNTQKAGTGVAEKEERGKTYTHCTGRIQGKKGTARADKPK